MINEKIKNKDRREKMNAFIENSMRIEISDNPDSVLWMAVNCREKEAVLAALENGGNPLAVMPSNSNTALINSVYRDDAEIFKILLPLSDPNTQNNEGETALIKAGSSFKKEIISILLGDARVDADLKDKYGGTALKYALNEPFPDATIRGLALASSQETREAAFKAKLGSLQKFAAGSLTPPAITAPRWKTLDALSEWMPEGLMKDALETLGEWAAIRTPRLTARWEAMALEKEMALGDKGNQSAKNPSRRM